MKSRTLAFALLALGSVVLASACSVGVSAGPDVCLAEGEACAVDSDCCSGICDSAGFCATSSVVVVQCAEDNVACNTDADCCSFLCASDGFCGLPTTSCNLDNEPCNTDADCCSDLCASDGFCGIP